ncbi:MAG TPA: carbohydrate ABC transporter permease [Mycobacteriales bacterium]|nr:carbohydrate ABC transporter permease [Mycobacteriales bacterium]
MLLLAGGFFWLYPLLWALSGSLKSDDGFLDSGVGLIPHQLIWHNYVDAWNGASFGRYFLNSVIITALTVLLTLLFTSMAGYALARTEFPGRRFLLVVILVTFFLPRGYTIVPVYDIVNRVGLLNTLWSVVIVQVAGGMVFNTFLFMGYFRTVAKEVEEAARVDGAGFHQIYFYVILPLARPMLATLGLFSFINSWNDFMTPLVFTLGEPHLRTLAVGLYAFISQTSTDWTALCAGSVISLAPIILVFIFAQRHIVAAIAGAVKG